MDGTPTCDAYATVFHFQPFINRMNICLIRLKGHLPFSHIVDLLARLLLYLPIIYRLLSKYFCQTYFSLCYVALIQNDFYCVESLHYCIASPEGIKTDLPKFKMYSTNLD